MCIYLFLAGMLCFLLGLAHSILGEYLIFKTMRMKGQLVPSKSAGLKERHVRILWATWHMASFFGWGIGAMLVYTATESDVLHIASTHFLLQTIFWCMLCSSVLVLVGTKGKHPGWAVLFLISILTAIGYLNYV